MKNFWIIKPKKLEKCTAYFPCQTETFLSCFAVLKKLFWRKTISPMKIPSCPLDVIPVKLQKNRSLEQMVKICNQSFIITWLLVRLILNMLFSKPPLKKKKRNMKRICPQQSQSCSSSNIQYLSHVLPVTGYSTTLRYFIRFWSSAVHNGCPP